MRVYNRTVKATLVAAVLGAVGPVGIAGTLALGLAVSPAAAGAQEHGLKLTVGDVGLGIGDVRRIDGVRLNFRDRHMERVRGINATIWTPYDHPRGAVYGAALGVPLTGADEIRGLALGAGVAVERDFVGLGVAPVGMGAGEGMRGIVVGGIGAGSGGDLDGIMVGGVGVGAGGAINGIAVGGIGAGAGGDLTGIGLGGVGLGAGGDVTGLALGGVGVGAGGDLRGIAIGGIGVGAGGDLVGLSVGGVGIGAGGELRGIAVAGGGVGASRITGLVLAGLAAGGEDVRGAVVAPAYFRVAEGGRLRGVAVSAYNDIRGEQRGLAIGLINIAEELHGLQIGLINIARNKESFPVLPLANYNP